MALSQQDIDALLALDLEFSERSPPNERAASTTRPIPPLDRSTPARSVDPGTSMSLRQMATAADTRLRSRNIDDYPVLTPTRYHQDTDTHNGNELSVSTPGGAPERDESNIDPRDINNYPALSPARAQDDEEYGEWSRSSSMGPPYSPSVSEGANVVGGHLSRPGLGHSRRYDLPQRSSRIMQLAERNPPPYASLPQQSSRSLRVMNPDPDTEDQEPCQEIQREPGFQPGRQDTYEPSASFPESSQTPRAAGISDPTGSGEATPRFRPRSPLRVTNLTDHEDTEELNWLQDVDAAEKERKCRLARSSLDQNIAYLCQRLDACLNEDRTVEEDAMSLSSWVNNAPTQGDDSTDAHSEASEVSYDMVSDAEDWDHLSNEVSESDNDTEDSEQEFVLPLRGSKSEQKKRKATGTPSESQQSVHRPRFSAYEQEVKRFKEPATPAMREIYAQEPDIHPDEMKQLQAAIALSLGANSQPRGPIRDSISETERARRNQIILARGTEDCRPGPSHDQRPTRITRAEVSELYKDGNGVASSVAPVASFDSSHEQAPKEYLPPVALKLIAKHLYFPDCFNLAMTCKSFHNTLDKDWGLGISKQEYHRTLIKETFTPLPTPESLPMIRTTFCDVCLYRLPFNYFRIDVYEMLCHRINHFDSEHFSAKLKSPSDMRLVICADCEGSRAREQQDLKMAGTSRNTLDWQQSWWRRETPSVETTASITRQKPIGMEPSPCAECKNRDQTNGVCYNHNFMGQASKGPVWRPSERVYLLNNNRRDGLWYRDRS